MSFDDGRYHCSSCAAPVSFRAGASVFAVCPYCRATLLRKGETLETLGKIAELPEDISVLQLGTTGRVSEGSFALIGRITLHWSAGTWNEWFLIFDSGKVGWLAEAQGWYAISFERDASKIDKSILSLGKQFVFDKEEYTFTDHKEAVCTYSEGELPFTGAQGEKYLVYDAIGPRNAFASVSIVEERISLYVGKYYTFDQLSLAQVRVLDGW